MRFPDNFAWGAATASYQIEGAAFADGKGRSIWDAMSHTPEKIFQGNTGDVACDHVHRYAEDVGLMAKIGLNAYRFSISWPRVLPEGVGTVNVKGLDFYDRLVDALLANGIEPWVTLFHWDYPLALHYRGGWLNQDSADWFAAYTAVIVDKLSDRITHWMTQNEPQCFVGLGYWTAELAPALQLPFADVLLIAHHVLLAHGKAVQVIRARSKKPAMIGAAPVGISKIPDSNSPADIAAARACMFAVKDKLWNNTWFADPMILGHYPEDGLQAFGSDVPTILPEDMTTICQPLDFYGANIYHADTIRADEKGSWEQLPPPPGHALTTMKWMLTPDALYWGPRFLYERYKLPIAVTENGLANTDWVQLNGRIHDSQRIDFISRYLQSFGRAIADGVPAIGYFHWTLMDNFEWNEGYSQRFGLIYVDFQTQQRTLKESAHWYKEIIASNGTILNAEFRTPHSAFRTPHSAFNWPEGKQAALSFTFDDARFSQIDIGIPLLDSYGIKATFYVSIPRLEKRLDGWKEAITSGHEIGNHTFSHPCSGNFHWSQEMALEDFSLDGMEEDIFKANEQINRLLGITPTTFAYPCGQTFVGRGKETRSYVPLVADLFASGREYRGEAANDPSFCDMARLMGVPSDNVTFAQIEPFLTQLVETGGWLILAGHEINEDGLQTTTTALLKQIIEAVQTSSNIWVAPVGTVAEFITNQRRSA